MSSKIQRAIALGISADTTSAQRELRQVYSLLRQVKEPTDSLKASLALLNDALKHNEINQRQANDASKLAEMRAEKQTEKLRKLRAEHAAIFNEDRKRGLAVQADIQREAQSVREHQKALEARLATFKKEKAAREELNTTIAATLAKLAREERQREQVARAAREQAEAEARIANFNRNRDQGLSVQAGIQREAQSVREHQKALEARLATFKKEKAAREELNKTIGATLANLAREERQREQVARAAREQARAQAEADARASVFNRNRDRGLGVQADIQRERDAVAARRAELASKLDYQRQLAAEGQQYMQQFETSQQRVNRQIAEARQQFHAGRISAEQFGTAMKGIARQNSLLVQSFTQFRVALLSIMGPLVLMYKAYEAFTSSVRLSAELDAANARFKIFTGSVEEAKSQLQAIRDLASEAPISFAGAHRATIVMHQFGVASQSVIQHLREIAEITGGDTQRMEMLALAFAQSQAAGRLMGQELLQMVNAGFNPLKVISEQTGISLVDLKKKMEDGGISSEMVAKAFRDATKEGGRFHGLLEEIAGTTAGKLTRAHSEMEKLGTAFGNLIKPATDGTLEAFISQVQNLTEWMNLMSGDTGENSEIKKMTEELKLMEAELERVKSSWTQWNGLLDYATGHSKTLFGTDTGPMESNIAAMKERIKAAKELQEIEALAAKPLTDEERQAANTKRVTDAFQDEIDKAKQDIIDQRYGYNAPLVTGLLEQSVDGERDKLQLLIDQGAAYADIFDAANKEAQQRANALAGITIELWKLEKAAELKKEQAKEAEKLAKEQEKQKENKQKLFADAELEIRYKRDLLHLTEEEARVRQLLRDKSQQDLTLAEAKDLARHEKTIKALEAQNDLKEAAKKLKEGDNAAFIEEMARLQAMRDSGFIGGDLYQKEREKLLSDNTKTGQLNAAPRIEQGSQEAFKALTGQTLDRTKQQLDATKRVALLAQTNLDIDRKRNEILQSLVDQSPEIVGP